MEILAAVDQLLDPILGREVLEYILDYKNPYVFKIVDQILY